MFQRGIGALRGPSADGVHGMTMERTSLLHLYRHALAAVAGDHLVATHLERAPPPGPVYAVAVGKAAAAMLQGALAALGGRLAAALLITKYGYLGGVCRDQRVTCIESGHPLPDAASLEAGRRLLAFLALAPPGAELLFLTSGGASALVEVLPAGVGLDDLARANRWLLACGADIDAVNRVRKGLSRIKAGRLAAFLDGRPVRNLLLSDVPGDDPRVIGSGLLVPHPASALHVAGDLPPWLRDLLGRAPPPPPADAPAFARIATHLLAGNHEARAAAAARARAAGLAVHGDPGVFQGDAVDLGRHFARRLLDGPPGLYLWGGESTVRLPEQPGRGGRSQSLALAAARALAGRDGVLLLAAGSDGSDGPTVDAGALVDGATVARGRAEGLDPDDCLRRADAGTFLAASGDLLQTGPTGTNVMDLVLGLKRADG